MPTTGSMIKVINFPKIEGEEILIQMLRVGLEASRKGIPCSKTTNGGGKEGALKEGDLARGEKLVETLWGIESFSFPQGKEREITTQ